MRMVARRRGTGGMTLTEVMVSSALAGIVCVAALSLTGVYAAGFTSQLSSTDAEENLWQANELIQREIRKAGSGFGMCPGGRVQWWPAYRPATNFTTYQYPAGASPRPAGFDRGIACMSSKTDYAVSPIWIQDRFSPDGSDLISIFYGDNAQMGADTDLIEPQMASPNDPPYNHSATVYPDQVFVRTARGFSKGTAAKNYTDGDDVVIWNSQNATTPCVVHRITDVILGNNTLADPPRLIFGAHPRNPCPTCTDTANQCPGCTTTGGAPTCGSGGSGGSSGGTCPGFSPSACAGAGGTGEVGRFFQNTTYYPGTGRVTRLGKLRQVDFFVQPASSGTTGTAHPPRLMMNRWDGYQDGVYGYANPQPVAEGVEDLQVAVLCDSNGDQTLAQFPNENELRTAGPQSTLLTDEWYPNVRMPSGTAGTDLSGDKPVECFSGASGPTIARLRITLSVRTKTAASSDIFKGRPVIENHLPPGATAAGTPPPADGYRRRMLTTVVSLRNM